jgi:hypothetical protein
MPFQVGDIVTAGGFQYEILAVRDAWPTTTLYDVIFLIDGIRSERPGHRFENQTMAGFFRAGRSENHSPQNCKHITRPYCICRR